MRSFFRAAKNAVRSRQAWRRGWAAGARLALVLVQQSQAAASSERRKLSLQMGSTGAQGLSCGCCFAAPH